MLGEIVDLIVHTLIANDKYPVQDWKKLPQAIQMQLSEKRKTFAQFFVPFLHYQSNFKHLKKRMIVRAHVFPKLQTVKVLVRPLCKKRCVMKRFYSQHVKASQILPKSL